MIVVGEFPLVFNDRIMNLEGTTGPEDILCTWGNGCNGDPQCSFLEVGSIVRDLGRRINFYDDTNTLISTFRQIQLIGGAGSEGVDDATTVEPWRVGWMFTFVASSDLLPFPLSLNYVRSAEKSTRAEIIEKIRAFLAAYKGRITMDRGVGSVRWLVRA